MPDKERLIDSHILEAADNRSLEDLAVCSDTRIRDKMNIGMEYGTRANEDVLTDETERPNLHAGVNLRSRVDHRAWVDTYTPISLVSQGRHCPLHSLVTVGVAQSWHRPGPGRASDTL